MQSLYYRIILLLLAFPLWVAGARVVEPAEAIAKETETVAGEAEGAVQDTLANPDQPLAEVLPGQAFMDTLRGGNIIPVDYIQGLRVYLDCRQCDDDFVRTKLTFVDFMRARQDAQVHILVSSQRTGSGGRKHTLVFIGQHEFAGRNDTLTVMINQEETEDDLRIKLVQMMTLGLTRYVARTPLADQMTVLFKGAVAPTIIDDRWNYWVYRLSTNGSFNGERTSNRTYLRGSFSANRITETSKIRLWLNQSYDERNFIVTEDEVETTKQSITENRRFNGSVVWSLTDHWSVGGSIWANSDTYRNIRSSFGFAPALEYNLFPYAESTYRELRFYYRLGANRQRYVEETVFFKLQESLLWQALDVTLELKDRWGEVRTRLSGSHYLHDPALYRLSLDGNLNIRLFKGLALNLNGRIEGIHNQIELASGGDDEEDILLRRKQQQTNFRYWGNFGLSYTFGSIYNNVVNPRFGG